MYIIFYSTHICVHVSNDRKQDYFSNSVITLKKNSSHFLFKVIVTHKSFCVWVKINGKWKIFSFCASKLHANIIIFQIIQFSWITLKRVFHINHNITNLFYRSLGMNYMLMNYKHCTFNGSIVSCVTTRYSLHNFVSKNMHIKL